MQSPDMFPHPVGQAAVRFCSQVTARQGQLNPHTTPNSMRSAIGMAAKLNVDCPHWVLSGAEQKPPSRLENPAGQASYSWPAAQASMQGHGAKHVFENFIFPTVFVNAACWVAQPEYAFGAWQVPPTAAHPSGHSAPQFVSHMSLAIVLLAAARLACAMAWETAGLTKTSCLETMSAKRDFSKPVASPPVANWPPVAFTILASSTPICVESSARK